MFIKIKNFMLMQVEHEKVYNLGSLGTPLSKVSQVDDQALHQYLHFCAQIQNFYKLPVITLRLFNRLCSNVGHFV